ncbi:21_t:CDS:2, partial [Entrophospora sp. SA101]
MHLMNPNQSVIKKRHMTFTLYSYCVDNACSDPSLAHNFDKIIALIPGLDEQQIGPGIHLAAWSLMFLAMAAISILYNNYKKIDSV